MKFHESLDLNSSSFKDIVKQFLPPKAQNHIKMVDVSKKNPKIEEIIDFFKKHKNMINGKQCFRNAVVVKSVFEEANYVEGVFGLDLGGSYLPIEHAWNELDGIHFDITSELLFNGDITKGSGKYAQLIKIEDLEKANKIASSVLRAAQLIQRGKA